MAVESVVNSPQHWLEAAVAQGTALPGATQAAAAQAAAPAGGTGATAGAYDTAAHRDALIDLVNAMRTALVNVGIIKGSA